MAAFGTSPTPAMSAAADARERAHDPTVLTETWAEKLTRVCFEQAAAAQASREIDLYGPDVECIHIRTGYGWDWPDQFTEVMGFVVPGTDKLFAVHPTGGRPAFWTITHRPSGLSAGTRWCNRDTAEAAACWIYCNFLDKEALRSADSDILLEGCGARAKTAHTTNDFFRRKRRRRQQIGTVEAHQATAQRYWLERIDELEQLRRKWRDKHKAAMEYVATATVQINERVARVNADLARREEELRSREDMMELRERNATMEAARLAAIDRDLHETSQNILLVRNTLITGLRHIGNEELNDAPAMRQLRKVRLSGEEQEAHSENSSPST